VITHIDATNYRCFERLSVSAGELAVVAGANGSGKTTLLDIPVLLGDLLRGRDVSAAFMDPLLSRGARASALGELCFRHSGGSFSLGIEVRLPDDVRDAVVAISTPAVRNDASKHPTHVRYELRLQVAADQITVQNEYLFLFTHSEAYEAQRLPLQGENADQDGWRFVVSRAYGAESSLRSERAHSKTRLTQVDDGIPSFLRIQVENRTDFPASVWLLKLLLDGVVFFDPSWSKLRSPSQPGLRRRPLLSSAENLPWVALRLQEEVPDRFAAWVDHVRTALPQIAEISVREREDDHHAYFRVRYEAGFEVTSSGLSEGTLRIFALTLIAYAHDVPRLLVVEEPENSIHPQAIETVMQSLRSLYDRQVWVSTHSPVVLATTNLSELLITRLARDGSASVIQGEQHPRLREWKGAIDLGSLFATGVFE
jgi:energy-coupling factor transporter ATP-binding protein EcfA2